jgi:nicotinamide-nucleotide amidase
MKAEIITIGDELLIGQTIDTNSAWIASELNKIGIDVFQITSISDRKEHIIKTLAKTIGKTELVIITGGLGPTSDDITKPALCEFFNSELIFNENVFNEIEEMFRRRNWPMNNNNRRQAEVPANCTVLINKFGTAPGMRFEKEGTLIFSMAGVPFEMKHIMTEYVIPELSKIVQDFSILHRNIMVYGISESSLSEKLAGFETELPSQVKLAYLPSFGIVKLRLTAKGKNSSQLTKIIEHQVNKLYQIIPEYIYGENELSLEEVVADLLIEKKLTLCTAESCTGGNIARLITSIPGSSVFFKGSVIAYNNSVKTDLLGVKSETIKDYGAVSEQTVIEMACCARTKLKTDYAVATSGIAGPDGGTVDKPAGTVWIAVSSINGTSAKKYVFGNDRIVNINRFSVSALDMLRKQIISE